MDAAPNLFSYPKYRPDLEPAPFLPTTRAEMDALGWDSCDVIVVTGDAYVDHPSFGMAVIGRVLEAQGFRVGIISQPDWQDTTDFEELGRPNLYFGVTGGNMDSLVNHYTSDRRIRSNDAYTAGGEAGKRPDRATLVYSARCKEAYKGIPIVLGGIESSLRRVAHFDYWSEKIRRSILLDAKADVLLYGNAERAVVELTHRLAGGESFDELYEKRDIRGIAFPTRGLPEGWAEIDRRLGAENKPSDKKAAKGHAVVRLPSFEDVKADPIQYASASRAVHRETNPGNARPLIQSFGNRDVWLTPPPIPMTTPEMDGIYDLPYARAPHPKYGKKKIPAWEMIRFSIIIERGCFGGCAFCSITEHEGRVIQTRSHESIIKEIETIRDTQEDFTGVISDLGGPTANMYGIRCKSTEIEAACRKPSCVFPKVCENLQTDHGELIDLYRKARDVEGVKKVMVASGVRYDLAVEDPRYIKELAEHHIGGYLKIAPEHVAERPLNAMMKPGIGAYDKFAELFAAASESVGKKQYLIPYFIAAHPNTTDSDMLELALWLKRQDLKVDQVQTFLPSPMSTSTAMYYSRKNPLKPVKRDSPDMEIPTGKIQRKLHKALLRYHDPENWPTIREALEKMGRADLIGTKERCLVPYETIKEKRERESKSKGKQSKGQKYTKFNTKNPRKGQARGGRVYDEK